MIELNYKISLKMYGVKEELARAVKSFHEESEACVRIGRKEDEWFSVKFRLSRE